MNQPKYLSRSGSRYAWGSALSVLLGGLLSGCTQPTDPLQATSPPISIYENIEYASYQVEDETRSLQLDLYQPKQSDALPLPVIVYVHGGGWEEQSRKDCPGGLLSQYGYAVICPSYRYSYEASFPAQIHDLKAAVRWVRAMAYVHHLDPERIGVVGESAGGHLSALLGASINVPELEGDMGHNEYSSEVHAVVDWFGPTDFSQFPAAFEGDPTPKEFKQMKTLPWAHLTRVVTQLLGGPIADHAEQVKLANPITYVSDDDPPFLVLHGTEDTVVPIAQSAILVEALAANDVEVDFHRLEGRGHSVEGDNGDDIDPVILGKTMSFFYRHLKYDYGYETAEK